MSYKLNKTIKGKYYKIHVKNLMIGEGVSVTIEGTFGKAFFSIDMSGVLQLIDILKEYVDMVKVDDTESRNAT